MVIHVLPFAVFSPLHDRTTSSVPLLAHSQDPPNPFRICNSKNARLETLWNQQIREKRQEGSSANASHRPFTLLQTPLIPKPFHYTFLRTPLHQYKNTPLITPPFSYSCALSALQTLSFDILDKNMGVGEGRSLLPAWTPPRFSCLLSTVNCQLPSPEYP
jgi:hypothetical protein